MFLSDHEARVAKQRHNEMLDQARHRRLVRDVQAARQPSAPVHRRIAALVARVWAPLFATRAERRSMGRDTA